MYRYIVQPRSPHGRLQYDTSGRIYNSVRSVHPNPPCSWLVPPETYSPGKKCLLHRRRAVAAAVGAPIPWPQDTWQGRMRVGNRGDKGLGLCLVLAIKRRCGWQGRKVPTAMSRLDSGGILSGMVCT